MQPEATRRERYTSYATLLRERFQNGCLAELQSIPQWVVWRAELDGEGKQKKAPYNPNYRNARASVKIAKSWGTLEQSLTTLESGLFSGIGFMITPPLVFIDLDHCVSRETGEISQTAQEIVQHMNSYTEISPSGTGLHVLAYGTLPGKNMHSAIEVYGKDRFTTLTTRHLQQTPSTIEQRQAAIDVLYRRYAPQPYPPPVQNTRGGVDRGKILHELPPEAQRDEGLQRLLSGDMAGYETQSSADFVLIMKLLHWTGDDIALTRQFFLSSPFGQREKATRSTGDTTYVDMTIQNVLRKRRNPPQRR